MRTAMGKKGVGLIVVVAVVLALTLMLFSLSSVGVQNMGEASYQSLDNLALKAARGGVQYALFKLNYLFQISGPPAGSRWLGYGNRICELTRNDSPCVPACAGGFGSNGIFGGNVSAPWNQSLDRIHGSFSVYYYSNLLDCNGDPITTARANPVDPTKPGYLTVFDPLVGRIDVPPSSVALVSTGIVSAGISGGALKRTIVSILRWQTGLDLSLAGGDINAFALSGNFMTDSYISDSATYCAQCPASCKNGNPDGTPCAYNSIVGTNSSGNPAIDLSKGNAEINGMALVGIGGSVAGATAGNPTGGWRQCNHCVDTTLATLPSLPDATKINNAQCGNSSGPCNPVSGAAGLTCSAPLPAGYNYGSLTVDKNGVMYLQPGNYTFSSITLAQNAALYVCLNTNPPFSASAPSSQPAILYLSNNLITPNPSPQMDLGQNSIIGVVNPGTGGLTPTVDTNKAGNSLILGNGNFASINLPQGHGYYTMGLHAPGASYTGTGFGTVDVYGSIVIGSLPARTAGDINVHYDGALARYFIGQPQLAQSFFEYR